MNLHKTVKRRRLKLALSQVELAKKANVSQSNVSKFENGKKSIRGDDLLSICAAVGIKRISTERRKS